MPTPSGVGLFFKEVSLTGFILVDCNSLGHAFHNSAKLTVGDFQTQAIFGVVKAVRELMTSMPDRRLIVLWDGRAEWRKAIYPDYKGNRKPLTAEQAKDKEAYKKQVPILQAALERLGVEQKLNYGAEADDLAGFLVPRLVAGGCHVLLVTGDRDWLQMVGPKVVWNDPRSGGHTVTHDVFLEKTGFSDPVAFLDGKAIQGDTSDNIEGIAGIGEKTAADLLAEFGGVQRFLSMVDTGAYTPKKRKSKKAVSKHPEEVLASPEGRAIYERNIKLMDLLRVPVPDPVKMHKFNQSFDPEGFRVICTRLAFISILKDFNNFVRPFGQRAEMITQTQERKAA